jgi:hypothetical protein
MEVNFVRDARAGSSGATAREYLASFVPPLGQRSSAAYTLRIDAVTADGAKRSATLELIYNRPSAKFTGRFADRIDDGDLVIEAEVAGDAAGTLRLEGSLYDAEGIRQVAWATSKFHRRKVRRTAAISWTRAARPADERPVPAAVRHVDRRGQERGGAQPAARERSSYECVRREPFRGDPTNDAEMLSEAAALRERIARLQHAPAE